MVRSTTPYASRSLETRSRYFLILALFGILLMPATLPFFLCLRSILCNFIRSPRVRPDRLISTFIQESSLCGYCQQRHTTLSSTQVKSREARLQTLWLALPPRSGDRSALESILGTVEALKPSMNTRGVILYV